MTVLFTAPSEAKKTPNLGSWEKTWLMQFNADKSFTMKAGRSKTIINKSYKIHDHPLQSTDSVKYLGLTLTSDLKINTHINNVTATANSSLGLLRRNLKISSQAVKTQAYQSLVRPHLEYAATVWSPHTSDNIKKVEMVQRRSARYVCNRWHNTSSVSEMVGHLGGSPSLYVAITWDSIWCTGLHIRLRGTPGRGGWCHPANKHVGSIRGGIFHWARPMIHTNSHSYPPPSPFGTASHLTLSPPPSLDSFRRQLTRM